jgi:hypothetical protein
MQNKLTAEIIAKYWGSKIEAAHSAFTNGKAVFKYLHLADNGVSDGSNWFSFSDCKLILKPLSEITDEEGIEVAKIATNIMNAPQELKDVQLKVIRREEDGLSILVGLGGLIEIYFTNGDVFLRSSLVDTMYMPTLFQAKIVDYFRAKSFDLDNGIKDGWAKKAE